MATVIILPFPVSVNGLYAGKERRFKSPAYKQWIALAGYATLGAYKTFEVPVRVCYEFGRPDKRIRDLANFIKAIDDFMVMRGILKDDSLIYDFRVRWVEKAPVVLDRIGVRVTIEELSCPL